MEKDNLRGYPHRTRAGPPAWLKKQDWCCSAEGAREAVNSAEKASTVAVNTGATVLEEIWWMITTEAAAVRDSRGAVRAGAAVLVISAVAKNEQQ